MTIPVANQNTAKAPASRNKVRYLATREAHIKRRSDNEIFYLQVKRGGRRISRILSHQSLVRGDSES